MTDKKKHTLADHLNLDGVGILILAIIIGLTISGTATAIWGCA